MFLIVVLPSECHVVSSFSSGSKVKLSSFSSGSKVKLSSFSSGSKVKCQAVKF